MHLKSKAIRVSGRVFRPENRQFLFAAATIVGGFFASDALAESRTWTSSDGKFSVDADLVETSFSAVVLRRADGKSIQVAIDQLCSADKQFLSKNRNSDSKWAFPKDEFGETVDLLPLIDVEKTLKGTWTRDGESLLTGKEIRTQINVPFEMPLEYELSATIQLEQGNNSFNFGLPIEDHTALFMIDGFNGALTGLNIVAGRPIRNNVTTYRKRLIEDNEPHEFVCTVHRRHASLSLDGVTIFDWTGRPNELWYHDVYWTPEDFPANRVVLGSWKTRWRLSKLNMRPILSSAWNDLSVASSKDSRKASIALIETETGSGSGFIAGRNLVATNHHVVAAATCDEIRVYLGDEDEPLSVNRILVSSEQDDLAILEVDTDHHPLPIAWDGSFPKGETVNVYGNPAIESNVILRGARVQGTVQSRLRMEGQDYMQIAANVNPGSSGGPVLNQSGQVVGVIVMKANGEGESFLRDASRRFDAGLESNQRKDAHGIALAVPGRTLIDRISDARHASSEAADVITVRHDAIAVVGRSLGVAGYDFLRMIGNAPQRVIAEGQSRRAQESEFAMPPAKICVKIREITHASLFTRELDMQRESVNKKLSQLAGRPWINAESRQSINELRAVLARLKKFADRPTGTFARFEGTASELGSELQRLAGVLRESLQESQAI